jgi:hypothetical protein
MAHVLIVFQADTEATEQLALAVAVGAVEAEASIRLRRLTHPGSPELGHQGYGQLQGSDLAWADTIAVLLESPTPADLAALLDLLAAMPPAAGPKRSSILDMSKPPNLLSEALADAFRAAGIASFEIFQNADAAQEELLAAMKRAGHQAAA